MLLNFTMDTNRKLLLTAILIVGVSSLFYLYEFFLRVSPSSITHELMRDLQVDAASIGTMAGFFFFGYAPMQIPVGLLCDRFGPKILLILATLCCSISTLAFSYTESIYVASITRFLIGIASAFAFVGPLVMATNWFEEKHLATVAGVIQLVGCLGAIFAGEPISALINNLGWRQTMVYAAIFGTILAIIFIIVLKNSPNEHVKSEENTQPLLNQIKQICNNSKTWWLGLVAFCCWAPISIFAELWGTSFITTAYHANKIIATHATSWVWIGIGVSSVLAGLWSAKIQKRNPPILVLNIVGLIASLSIIFYHFNNMINLEIMLFLLGVAAGVQPITFGIACDQNPPTQHGAAMGFNNMAVIFGGVIFQPLVGYLLTVFWDKQMFDGAPVYNTECYQYALMLIPLCYIVGFIVTKFKLKETFCKPSYKN